MPSQAPRTDLQRFLAEWFSMTKNLISFNQSAGQKDYFIHSYLTNHEGPQSISCYYITSEGCGLEMVWVVIFRLGLGLGLGFDFENVEDGVNFGIM